MSRKNTSKNYSTPRPKYRKKKPEEALKKEDPRLKIASNPTETTQTPATKSGSEPPKPPNPPSSTSTLTPEPHPTDQPKSSKDKPMSLMDHLNELRRCLIKATIAVFLAFIACWVVVDPIFNTLVDPLLKALPKGSHAIYTTLPEGFFTRMYIAFVGGVFVASPWIFYQIWSFIAPGLYEEEKRFILPIAFISAFFFIGGGLFCFHIVFPFAFSFFVSFATEEIVAMPKVSDYLNFVLKLLLAFGLIFEMPLFSFFLSRLGLISAQLMRNVRKYAILVIFIVAAILTPPDVVSQLLMAGPMLLLYEISILIAAAFGKKKKIDSQAKSSTETEKPTAL
ncbi:MAG: twin-arginine translocase subunit TatC [Desulfovibrionaceae bacterium]|nr:twin-arginine translocase subunit TatC [Desulfovibrionaceae bacterium]